MRAYHNDPILTVSLTLVDFRGVLQCIDWIQSLSTDSLNNNLRGGITKFGEL